MLLASTAVDGLYAEAVEARLVDIDAIGLLVDRAVAVGIEIGNLVHVVLDVLILVGVEGIRLVVVNKELVAELRGIHEAAFGVVEGHVEHSDVEACELKVIGDEIEHLRIGGRSGMLGVGTEQGAVERLATLEGCLRVAQEERLV